MRMVRAELVSVLSDRIRAASGDPKQLRGLVYELARTRLMEQLEQGADTPQAHQMLQMLESAIRDVETTFERSHADPPIGVLSGRPSTNGQQPPELPRLAGDEVTEGEYVGGDRPRRAFTDQLRSLSTFGSIGRLATILLIAAAIASAVVYWWPTQPQLTPAPAEQSSVQQAPSHTADDTSPQPADNAVNKTSGPQPADPASPRPATYGIYALSEGQLQELKPLPGKVPDRRVAISAAITTPSATTVAGGDVRFIVFRPDQPTDASGTFEVRVVAKVARAMGVDSTGKASVAPTGDTWVIRNMTYSYKAGPLDDQPKMLLLQPESEDFRLSPGRYVVVIKGIGYDFTVAGDVSDPNQCVERINATNGAFYSPCPPR
jgi:hypothetical protein